MDSTQFRRWYEFSLRMAHRGYPRMKCNGRRFVASCVKDFFRRIDGWEAGLVQRIVGWDVTDNSGQPVDLYGHKPIGPYVCDMIAEMSDSWCPYSTDRERERWDDLWGRRISCCIRAGLDMASEPSAGVAGFTVGDLRRMYAGRVPDLLAGALSYKGNPFTQDGLVACELSSAADSDGVWL